MNLPEFQYELVQVGPADALQQWANLREAGRGIFSPVILDSPEDYQLGKDELAALQKNLTETLASASALSAEVFFDRRRDEMGGLLEELEAGDWPAVPHEFEPHLIGQSDTAFIVKVPTPHSWEALAYIGFGGWNDCPTDEEHVAILRHWHEQYGAKLFAQGRDMIECIVDRPPATREAALALAREQLLYAPGTLSEFGHDQTLQNLAAALLNSRHWIFWWD
jgi:hypothetical protein